MGLHFGEEGGDDLAPSVPQVEAGAGWNKVLLKLPFQPDGGTRLKKWMFTFVLTDLTGRQALDGLIYSPERVLPSAPSRTSRR